MYAFLGASLVTVVMVVGYRFFFNIWVGGRVMPGTGLIILFGIFGIFQMYGATYSLFMNGIGKIKLQFYSLLVSALLFVPMVMLLYKLGFGLISLVIPGILINVSNSVLFRYQFRLVMLRKARGIWNR
jgi:O-antigen/teichoic acid export membrane protein